VLEASRRLFQSSREDSVQFPTQQKLDPLFPSRRACETSRRPSMLRRFCQLSKHSFGRQGNIVPTLFSVWEESRVLYRHELGRQLATIGTLGKHRLDTALIRKRMKRVMERRLQFFVRTLSAYVRTQPREIRIRLDLGLLKPINRGI